MSRRAAWTLIAAAIWTVWVWTTRIWNILQDAEHDGAFKAVHSALAVVSVGFAVAVFMIGLKGVRARGDERASTADRTGTPV